VGCVIKRRGVTGCEDKFQQKKPPEVQRTWRDATMSHELTTPLPNAASRSRSTPVPSGIEGIRWRIRIIHYLIDRGKPQQNGKVERSHRTDQEQFYSRNIFSNLKDLERKIKLWNMNYNNLEHCGLNGKSPNQFLANYQLINPPKVYT